MKNALVTNSVSKNFGSFRALNEVSISVAKGSVFGLLGPNGAGKTTLIRIINQITMPDTGTVLLDGEPLQAHHIKDIGYLPEERGLYKTMKVGEQILYLAQLKGMSKTDAKKKLDYWLDKFEIKDWHNKKIQELSKGMAQKIQFIVTVIHQPKLLIFDEPFSGFDPINANLIKDEILQLRNEGATIIFATHRMESVEEMCDDIALIHESNKLLEGNLQDIKQQFKTNTFEVGLVTDNEAQLTEIIKEKFEVSKANYKSLNMDLKLNIKLKPNESPNQLLTFLTSKAEVNHFIELVPTVNEIFIKTVNNS